MTLLKKINLEDLFYRLSTIEIKMSPLRKKKKIFTYCLKNF